MVAARFRTRRRRGRRAARLVHHPGERRRRRAEHVRVGAHDALVGGASGQLVRAEAARPVRRVHQAAGADERVELERAEPVVFADDAVDERLQLLHGAAGVSAARRQLDRAPVGDQLAVDGVHEVRRVAAARRLPSAVPAPHLLQPHPVDDVVGVVAPHRARPPAVVTLPGVRLPQAEHGDD